LTSKDWLSVWWEPFQKGGGHAPIVMVADKILCHPKSDQNDGESYEIITYFRRRKI